MAQYDFWFGPDTEDRRVKYAKAFRPEYQANGDDAQRRIAAVETAFRAETGIELPDGYSSGWRPAVINEATSNAGKKSTHLTAQAGDKRNNSDGALTWWCLRNQHVLEIHGLYMEHPVATVIRAWKWAKEQGREPTPWSHLQTVPPASHNRIYFPDAASVTEWKEFTEQGGVPGMTYNDWLAMQPKVAKRGGKGVEA